jgi:hypothetical protein
MENKTPSSIADQIALLKQRGLLFNDELLVLPFLKSLSVRFTCMSRVLTHQHFPYKIGYNTLGTNEADQYNQTTFARFIIHFIVNGFLWVR